jgi:hypothetical protein
MASARQLLRSGHACGTGADNRNRLARLFGGNLWFDPALFPPLVDDGAFDRFDRDGLIDDVQRARCLARRGADAARKLGEIVGRMKVGQRLAPIVFIDQVIPVRDLVVHRTAVMAVRNAAVHAARRLPLQPRSIVRDHEFAVVLQPFRRRIICAVLAFDFEKACCLAHCNLTLIQLRRTRLRGARPPVCAGRVHSRAALP